MPPKKATTAKAKATPAKLPAATAASERPRRAAAKEATAPTPTKKAAVKKAPAAKAPAKAATTTIDAPARGRGRPPKTAQPVTGGKKRGRPAKTAEEPEADAEEPPKKRGRPAKGASSSKEEEAVPETEKAPPKKRGRPPKGGETTKITQDDPAAAEQLEEELVDAAEADEEDGSSKPAPPVKKGKAAAKGKGRKAKQVAEDVVAETEEDGVADGAASAGEGGEGVEMEADEEADGKQYWLMKAEQIDREEKLQDGSVFNAKFTIDNLRGKAGPEPWDGVRNPTACKNMREMKLGDLAFFYASGEKGGLKPGIVGIMEVVKEHEPDMTAFDEKHPGYVENAKMRGTEAKPRWSLVHVEFRKKLSKPVGLKELQKYANASGALADMQEFKAARLSVSKVTTDEWNFIVVNLIEGYEDEAAPVTAMGDEQDDTLPTTAKAADAPIINGIAEDQVALTSETAAPSIEVNGTSRATSRKPSSRPTSRAATKASSRAPSQAPPSRAASRAPSKGPSRQASLAPPRAQSRGRSRTPASRAGSVKPLTGVAEEMETLNE